MLTTVTSGCTIYTGVLYLHNGLMRSKKRGHKVLSSTLLDPKEKECIAEDFNAELAHLLFDVR